MAKSPASASPGQLAAPVDPASMPAPLADALRVSAERSAAESLAQIQKLQAATRTRDGKIKSAKFIAAVLALRFEGFTPTDTAKVLGVSLGRVNAALMKVRQNADLNAQLERLDNIIVPLAVDNVARLVMNGDKETTLRVMDGRGLFRTHKSIEANIRKTVMELKVIVTRPDHLPAGAALPQPKPGVIVGAPLVPEQMENV